MGGKKRNNRRRAREVQKAEDPPHILSPAYEKFLIMMELYDIAFTKKPLPIIKPFHVKQNKLEKSLQTLKNKKGIENLYTTLAEIQREVLEQKRDDQILDGAEVGNETEGPELRYDQILADTEGGNQTEGFQPREEDGDVAERDTEVPEPIKDPILDGAVPVVENETDGLQPKEDQHLDGAIAENKIEYLEQKQEDQNLDVAEVGIQTEDPQTMKEDSQTVGIEAEKETEVPQAMKEDLVSDVAANENKTEVLEQKLKDMHLDVVEENETESLKQKEDQCLKGTEAENETEVLESREDQNVYGAIAVNEAQGPGNIFLKRNIKKVASKTFSINVYFFNETQPNSFRRTLMMRRFSNHNECLRLERIYKDTKEAFMDLLKLQNELKKDAAKLKKAYDKLILENRKQSLALTIMTSKPITVPLTLPDELRQDFQAITDQFNDIMSMKYNCRELHLAWLEMLSGNYPEDSLMYKIVTNPCQALIKPVIVKRPGAKYSRVNSHIDAIDGALHNIGSITCRILTYLETKLGEHWENNYATQT